MGDIYRLLKNRDRKKSCLVATVIEGEAFGEKALFSEGALVWESQKGGFFSGVDCGMLRTCRSGLTEQAGMKVFCERVGSPKRLVICGGGHVAIPLVVMGKMLDFEVTVLEDRPEYAAHAKSAGADRVVCSSFADGVAGVEGDRDTYFVIVTRGHRYDQICLEGILQKEHAYIGMIGSRQRVKIVRERLKETGIDRELLETIHAPIGLAIGAESPEEIAVSIMAEIVQVKNRAGSDHGYPEKLLELLTEEAPDRQGKVLATIVNLQGSGPRSAGTRMLIFADGRREGTIGGGCVEQEIFLQGMRMLRTGQKNPRICRVDMTGRDAGEDRMVCGGIADILLEPVTL